MYSLFFARKFLWARKINLICILSIALGVMTMTVVVSVMRGFGVEFRERIRGMLSHIVVEGRSAAGIDDANELITRIRAIEHVKAASPRVETLAFVQCYGHTTWTWLLGVDPQSEVRVSRLDDYVKGGLNFGKDGGLIVGSELAVLMGIVPDDTVTVMCPGPAQMRETSLRVTGRFKSGMYEYDSRQMYAPIKSVQELMGIGDRVTSISVAIDDYDANASAVVAAIEEAGARWLVSVQTWEQMRVNLLRAVDLEKNVMAVILAFIIVVAAFSITGTLSMMVVQKTRQIGIMKSMGGGYWGIMRIFVLEGLLMGLVGAGLGTVGGLAFLSRVNWVADRVHDITGFSVFPKTVYYLDKIPADINSTTIAVTFVATVLLSVLAAVYPAHRAARLDCVEALRYE